MQEFVNRQNVERALAEVFSGERSRYYLLSMVALATAAASSLAFGAVWLGFVLLWDETRKVLMKRLVGLRTSRRAELALEIASATILAAAPAIAWFARTDASVALACATLAGLLAHAAINARRGRMYTLAAAAPYFALGTFFVFDGAFAGDFAGGAACALTAIFVFAAMLHHTHRAAHAEAQNAQLVRQFNIALGDTESAAWEIDFGRERVIGADRLGTLIGRRVAYHDIVDGCFAASRDRAIARATFAPPERGRMRRIAFEHALEGGTTVVRHLGVVTTTPDGAPARLTCVTRIVTPARQTAAPPRDDEVSFEAEAVLAAQQRALRALANELATTGVADAAASEMPPHDDLKAQIKLIGARHEAIADAVDDLARARHEAEAANLAKSQFLANMSHELRTPLNAIIGYAEILQEDAEDKGDDTAVQDLNRILTAAKHLLSLINEILDLSKIEAGRMDVSAASFEPRRSRLKS